MKTKGKNSFLFSYYVEWRLRQIYYDLFKKKLRSKHYAGKKVAKGEEGNNILREMILNEKPIMGARFGGVEISAIAEVMFSTFKEKKCDLEYLKVLNRNAGFTEEEEDDYKKFVELMLESTKVCDFMGVWYNPMENWVCKNYMPEDSVLADRGVYDFWNYKIPFTNALKGKKVLVIHPFADSIISQYQKREELFENPNILPEFQLYTVKAIQTIGNQKDERFSSWFEALNYMFLEAMKIDFDVALIACGAYGFPLAAKIKKEGKTAIHMGGVLQLLFGIKGKRWDNHPKAKFLYNDSWIRPQQSEVCEGNEMIEGGCYW